MSSKFKNKVIKIIKPLHRIQTYLRVHYSDIPDSFIDIMVKSRTLSKPDILALLVDYPMTHNVKLNYQFYDKLIVETDILSESQPRNFTTPKQL